MFVAKRPRPDSEHDEGHDGDDESQDKRQKTQKTQKTQTVCMLGCSDHSDMHLCTEDEPWHRAFLNNDVAKMKLCTQLTQVPTMRQALQPDMFVLAMNSPSDETLFHNAIYHGRASVILFWLDAANRDITWNDSLTRAMVEFDETHDYNTADIVFNLAARSATKYEFDRRLKICTLLLIRGLISIKSGGGDDNSGVRLTPMRMTLTLAEIVTRVNNHNWFGTWFDTDVRLVGDDLCKLLTLMREYSGCIRNWFVYNPVDADKDCGDVDNTQIYKSLPLKAQKILCPTWFITLYQEEVEDSCDDDEEDEERELTDMDSKISPAYDLWGSDV